MASGTIVSGGGTDTSFFFAVQEVDSGGSAVGTVLENNGQETVLLGGTVLNTVIGSASQLDIAAGGSSLDAIVSAAGFEYLEGGVASGTIVESGGAIVVSSGSVASDAFISSGGSMTISSGGAATTPDLAVGGMLDLVSLTYLSGGSATINQSTDVLTVRDGPFSDTQALSGNYAHTAFTVTSDGNGGTLLMLGVACYCPGTLILTNRGEVAVEALAIDDAVITHAGKHRSIR